VKEKMNKTIEWLLDGPPWVRYRTRRDLLEQSESDPAIVADRQAMLAHPQIQALLVELAGWPGPALHRHNDAGHLLHKLVFISDLGLIARDKGADAIIRNVLQRQSKEGAFEVMANISPRFGGSGQDQLAWMLCDAPSVLYSLVKLGLGDNPAVRAAAGHLAGLSTDNGWSCVASPESGNFRGPGRKTDPCPYATLISLKALAQFPAWRESQTCQNGVRALLTLWEQRRERRPFLFAMGTDFVKLKAPLIWYDILHVLEVLTQFPFLQKDQRFLEMVDIMRGRADSEGRFTAASVWKAWSDWEFGQKKTPSFWITLQAQRMLKRIA
jgi:hypothetical protein